ncbi:aminotransferase class V-fold PLP-dependent enzyme [Roseicyclus sp. F158]|uniref:Aminotransferase class V-fold PLP-dependent enzyme n=1 Tax=Tropicimonas omnivorans TaxID=3075590 RepID=A0ABU3DHW7_9RHOB|nr:aminotransferase class V-fold PLP-dependent enzyme [Roseicyclus sp. F158]MDT0683304.1 aminotransferase class V-fold PLP-dependent enzyme [Roseicyclus sp. F158]
MTLSNGIRYLATPGPSVMPEEVLRAMHRSAPNIYFGPLHDLVDGLIPDLKRIARTSGDVAIYTANGHGIWEGALCNVCRRGDRILALSTGRFTEHWSEVGARLGLIPELIDFGRRDSLDPSRIEEALKADAAHQIRAVIVCHVDTSTGVRNDIAPIREILDRLEHPALLMVDTMASLACDRVEMDGWGADVLLAGCQKGLMTPPGLAFIWFNEKASAARERSDMATPYWDWVPRTRPQGFYQYFFGTAPTHHLYGLRTAVDMILEEGLEAVWRRHEILASAIWAAVETWGEGGAMELNIPQAHLRSHAVTAVRLPGGGKRLQDWLEANVGLTLGMALQIGGPDDPRSEGHFRIGHMGHVNAQMIMGVLGSIEAGLEALGIPRGEGAVAAAAKVIAEGAAG